MFGENNQVLCAAYVAKINVYVIVLFVVLVGRHGCTVRRDKEFGLCGPPPLQHLPSPLCFRRWRVAPGDVCQQHPHPRWQGEELTSQPPNRVPVDMEQGRLGRTQAFGR